MTLSFGDRELYKQCGESHTGPVPYWKKRNWWPHYMGVLLFYFMRLLSLFLHIGPCSVQSSVPVFLSVHLHWFLENDEIRRHRGLHVSVFRF